MTIQRTPPGSFAFAEKGKELLHAHFPNCEQEIGNALTKKGGDYGSAYDELSVISKRKKLNESWDEAMQRAQSLTEHFIETLDRESGDVREFWTVKWNSSYDGFCSVRNEIAELREAVFHGNSSDVPRSREQELFRSLLNRMLRSNAKEWFSVWGELDLHRLSPNDALELLHRCVCTWMWDEVKIISGQRAHCGDHISKGIMFNLIHSITGRAIPDSKTFDDNRLQLINEARLFIQRQRIEVSFYSSEGALYLKRPKESQKKLLKLVRPSPSCRRPRCSTGVEEGFWPRGILLEELSRSPSRRLSPSPKRRQTYASTTSQISTRTSTIPRRSPRFAGIQKKT
ncbi:hypothetical protein BWQ96_06764 [Gracilariopsis chorda]|uniref:Uncharacterized protein n=1 Tax=Gracilariopsis chorda TaxID=448386 RepID=A0A2V3IN10_9FLOR|nr:hypothetical protein BWQ96_06764 [Gracilariopsis chorda]|eukprot:PXF43471.1 hypothetical protein BWQ96_06764 [Gracilariopsis chorda]